MKKTITSFDVFKTNFKMGKLSLKKGVCISAAYFALMSGCAKKPPIPVEPEPIVYEIEDPADLLKPATGIVTDEITGEKIDLAKLKATYGDLYYLVEPLTQKELETRFWNLIYLYQVTRKENVSRRANKLPLINGFGYCVPAADDVFYKTLDEMHIQEQVYISKIKSSTDPKVVEYSMYYLKQFNQDKPSYVASQDLLDIFSGKTGVKLSNSEMKAYVSYSYYLNDLTKSIYSKYKIDTECIVCDLKLEIEKTK